MAHFLVFVPFHDHPLFFEDAKRPTRKKRATNKKAENDKNSAKKSGAKAKKERPKTASKAKTSAPAAKSGDTASSSPSFSDNNTKEEDDDRAACCLCHCALDYSDREAFFEADRRKEIEQYEKDIHNKSYDDSSSDESLYYQPTDPYVPKQLYDPSNALVYCDGCNRLYHQKCHFVPLMAVPRGTWHCLVCSTAKQMTTGKDAPIRKAQLKQLFQSPPPPAKLQQYTDIIDNKNTPSSSYHTPLEMQWEIATHRAKAVLWQKTLEQSVPSSIQGQLSNWRQAKSALETLTQTKQNRQHFLDNKASKRGSQELAQTLVKLAGAKWKMRQIILNLEDIRVNPERHIYQIHQWAQQGIGITTATTAILATATTNTATTTTNGHSDKDGATNKEGGEEGVTTNGHSHKEATAKDKEKEGEGAEVSATATGLGLPLPPKSFLERIVFPFGQYPARSIPRTPEMEEELEGEKNSNNASTTVAGEAENTNAIPKVIVTSPNGNADKSSTAAATTTTAKKNEKSLPIIKKKSKDSSGAKEAKKTTTDDAKSTGSSSSGVSLDDLKCCICLIGDATDENDLLLCDGLGCCRAFHMECLEPQVSPESMEGKEDEDWFCPLCSSLAECMHTVQSHFMGEEWDHRRTDRQWHEANKTKEEGPENNAAANDKKKGTKGKEEEIVNKGKEEDDEEEDGRSEADADDEDSLKSWEKPDEGE